MELLGGFHAHLDLENHGSEWRIHWNIHLDASSRIQVKLVCITTVLFFEKLNISVHVII